MSEVGRLNIRLDMDTSRIGAGVRDAQSQLRTGAQRIGRFGDSMMRRVTLPLLAVGAAMGGLMLKTGQFADELLDASATIGVSTDRLQQWRGMAARAGVDADAMAGAMETLNRRMARGSAVLVEGIEMMGYSLEEFQQLDPATQMDEILQVMVDMDEQSRIAFANKLNIPELLPVVAELIEAGGDVQEAWEQFEFISREDLERANEFRQQWDETKSVLGIIAMDVGIALIDLFQELFDLEGDSLAENLGEIRASVGELLDELRAVDPELIKFIAKLAGIAIIVAPAAKLVHGLGYFVSLLMGAKGLIVGLGIVNIKMADYIRETLLLVGASEKLAYWLTNIISPFGWLSNHLNTITNYISEHGGVVNAAAEAWKSLQEWIRNAIDAVNDFFTAGGSSLLGSIGQKFGMGSGGIMGFDSGGVVPGPLGSPQLAVVHGGETVLPTHKQEMPVNQVTLNNYFTVDSPQTADYAADSISQILQRRGNSGAMR